MPFARVQPRRPKPAPPPRWTQVKAPVQSNVPVREVAPSMPIVPPHALLAPPNAAPPAPVVDPSTGQPYTNQVTAGNYVQPGVTEQNLRNSGTAGISQMIHHQALAYANMRLKQLQQVAHVVNDPYLTQILGSTALGGDPLKVYAAASAQWAKLAHAAGYADPRVWLRDQMNQVHIRSGHNAVPE